MDRSSKEKAIIVDLDGTLCDITHRRKYIDGSLGSKDWNKFFQNIIDDKLNDWCADILCGMVEMQYAKVIFVTGRSDKYREITCKWFENVLMDCFIESNNLFMRKDGDYRKDFEVKKEIYEEHIKDNYDILFCIDDRQQVVDMWREAGLVCLQCDKGDF